MELVLKDFRVKWCSLSRAEDQQPTSGADRLWLEGLESRRLQSFLQQKYKMPSREGVANKMKPPKKEATPIKANLIKEILKRMKEEKIFQDRNQAFQDELKELQLKLGHAKSDDSCLFRSLDQLASAKRESVSEGNNDTAHHDLQQSIVGYVLSQNSSNEARARFRDYHDKKLTAWAASMRRPNEWGDELVLRYFSSFYEVNLRVYMHLLENTMQFPHSLDRGDGASRLKTSFESRTHKSMGFGELLMCQLKVFYFIHLFDVEIKYSVCISLDTVTYSADIFLCICMYMHRVRRYALALCACLAKTRTIYSDIVKGNQAWLYLCIVAKSARKQFTDSCHKTNADLVI